MNYTPKFCIKLFMAFVIVAGITACTSAEKDKTKTVVEEKEKDTAGFAGTLDTLFIKSSTFDSVAKGPLVFSFVFRGKDTLTLYGWNDKGSKKPKFDTVPDIKLLKAKASITSYDPNNVMFGNVVLTKKEIDDIKKLIKDKKYNYLLFAPFINGISINYEIMGSYDNPTTLAKTAAEPTGVKANPSPPKPWE